MFKRLKNKKGFSIIEVVISMVVVTIVTVTAISISSSASNNARKAMYNLDAQYFVADVIECYKVSNNPGSVPIEAISFRYQPLGVTYQEGGNSTTGYYYIFPLLNSGYEANISVSSNGAVNNEPIIYTLTVEVKDSNNNVIASANYSRGG